MKKLMRRLLAVVAAMAMVFGMAIPTMAATGGVGGKGSITVKNATKGHDYKAYKIFDASFNGDAVSYKVSEANKDNVSTEYFDVSTAPETINGTVYYTVSRKMNADNTPAKSDEEVIKWIKDNYKKFDTTGVDGTFDAAHSTVTFSNLSYGYYYITSSLGSAITIDSNTPTQSVYDKNSTQPEAAIKKIIAVDGVTKDKVVTADAHVGSTITFQVDAKTNNWEDKDNIRNQWELTDTPTNMTINADSVVVKFNDTELAKNAYTVSVGDDKKLTITVPMIDTEGNSIYEAKKANNGLIPIEITYTATIDATAGAAPAKNQIPDSNTEINTYAFQVAKVDGNNEPLPGAQFELWSNKGDSTTNAAALSFTDNGDGTYTYAPNGGEGTVNTLDMTTNTEIVIKGLDKSWTYTLKETKVPAGYNQAEDTTIEGSKLTKVVDGTDTLKTTSALHKEIIVNKAGGVLPTTGGMGTTIFYILGAALVIGAGVVLVTRRRLSK